MSESTAYQVHILPAALRQLAKLPIAVQNRIQERIDALAGNPRPHGIKALEGQQGFYRIRVGDYRVVFQIEAARLVVLVVRIGHRREIYRKL